MVMKVDGISLRKLAKKDKSFSYTTVRKYVTYEGMKPEEALEKARRVCGRKDTKAFKILNGKKLTEICLEKNIPYLKVDSKIRKQGLDIETAVKIAEWEKENGRLRFEGKNLFYFCRQNNVVFSDVVKKFVNNGYDLGSALHDCGLRL